MADKATKTPAITVTVTQRQRDWLYERLDKHGIPISRSVRDALISTYPELSEEENLPEAIPA